MPRQGLRGQGVKLPSEGPKVGLPARVFLFTIDQLSVMLDLDESTIMKTHLHFEGRSIGSKRRDLMIARNINAGTDKTPEWRVTEREFVRWMRFKGFKYYDRGVFQ